VFASSSLHLLLHVSSFFFFPPSCIYSFSSSSFIIFFASSSSSLLPISSSFSSYSIDSDCSECLSLSQSKEKPDLKPQCHDRLRYAIHFDYILKTPHTISGIWNIQRTKTLIGEDRGDHSSTKSIHSIRNYSLDVSPAT